MLNELAPFVKTFEEAEEMYMPGGPPMSPLTNSYFTTWALFDLPFGPDKETVGSCFIDFSKSFEMVPEISDAINYFQQSRMGIYEHAGETDGKILLRELITEEEFLCHPTSGYVGEKGELWFVRLCPPVMGADYHIVFTTPYIFTGMSKDDWITYLRRTMLDAPGDNDEERLHNLLKYGSDANHWHEFVMQGFHHAQHDAIFLSGIPDVKDSLPHASTPPTKSNVSFQLKVSLKTVRPPIWRRIVIPDVDLDTLHDIIQVTMGWENDHSYEYSIGRNRYSCPFSAGEIGAEDASQVTLSDLADQETLKFKYLYDFGDSWEHVIEIERVAEKKESTRPKCVKGKRACPPEDVGGAVGYSSFVSAINDTKHPDHDRWTEWYQGEFNPEVFDFDGVNKRLREIKLNDSDD